MTYQSLFGKRTSMKIRKAKKQDVAAIVALLANDQLGKQREDYRLPLPGSYLKAFEAINSDPNQELVVGVNEAEEVIATLQLTFIPYLTYQGGIRAQIEAVRTREDMRGKGVGKFLFEWAITRSKARKAHVLQLTTDKKRPDALGFYENLGFKASHEGMKLHFVY